MRLLCLLLLFCSAACVPVRAQEIRPSDPRIARDTFDPARHALCRQRAGGLELLVDTRVLVDGLRLRLPELGNVESIEKQGIGEAQFLVFSGWRNGGQYRRMLVAVRLRIDDDGYGFADRFFKVCIAREDAVCSDCILTVAGCRCWANEQAFCGNNVGDDMIFPRSALPDD
jgi:hypothetical protein